MLISLLLSVALADPAKSVLPPRPPGLACTPADPRAAALPQRPLLGVWQHPASSARFRVCADAGVAIVTGIDSRDGEVFQVRDARFDGNRLLFVSTMPSTDLTVSQQWRLQGTAVLDFTHTPTGDLLRNVPE